MNDEINERILRIESRLNTLETREEHITSTLDSNTRVLERIDRAITGEPKSGATGLVNKYVALEGRTERLEQFKQKWIYWLSGAAFLGSTLAGIMWFVINNYIMK